MVGREGSFSKVRLIPWIFVHLFNRTLVKVMIVTLKYLVSLWKPNFYQRLEFEFLGQKVAKIGKKRKEYPRSFQETKLDNFLELKFLRGKKGLWNEIVLIVTNREENVFRPKNYFNESSTYDGFESLPSIFIKLIVQNKYFLRSLFFFGKGSSETLNFIWFFFLKKWNKRRKMENISKSIWDWKQNSVKYQAIKKLIKLQEIWDNWKEWESLLLCKETQACKQKIHEWNSSFFFIFQRKYPRNPKSKFCK